MRRAALSLEKFVHIFDYFSHHQLLLDKAHPPMCLLQVGGNLCIGSKNAVLLADPDELCIIATISPSEILSGLAQEYVNNICAAGNFALFGVGSYVLACSILHKQIVSSVRVCEFPTVVSSLEYSPKLNVLWVADSSGAITAISFVQMASSQELRVVSQFNVNKLVARLHPSAQLAGLGPAVIGSMLSFSTTEKHKELGSIWASTVNGPRLLIGMSILIDTEANFSKLVV